MAFYFRLSEILRQYLASIKGVPAVEFTTEEISLHISGDEDKDLIRLLRHIDLVKFADTVPTSARKMEDVKALLSYIQETSPDTESDLLEKDTRGTKQ